MAAAQLQLRLPAQPISLRSQLQCWASGAAALPLLDTQHSQPYRSPACHAIPSTLHFKCASLTPHQPARGTHPALAMPFGFSPLPHTTNPVAQVSLPIFPFVSGRHCIVTYVPYPCNT